VIRGFAFGDSQTYGAGLAWKDTYSARAEAVLLAKGFNVELIDAGISGYGSLQVLRLIELKVLDWSPDFFVVDCRTFDQGRELGPVQARGLWGEVEGVLFKSRLYYVLKFGIGQFYTESARMRGDRGSFNRESQGNHGLILERATERGIKVVFLDYPFWDSGHSNALKQLAPVEELPKGAIVVPATEALRQSGKEPGELFFDNNHLNAEGSRIVGEALAETLEGVLR
jgi:hypothetical protein